MKKTLKQKISFVLAKHDPIHLIRIGAPSDEYDGEAGDFCRFLVHTNKKLTSKLIAEKLHLIFALSFSNTCSIIEAQKSMRSILKPKKPDTFGVAMAGSHEMYELIAKDVMQAIRNHERY